MNQELQAARIKHLAFKSKVRAMIYGAPVSEEVTMPETHCALGRWITETGRPMCSHFPEMAQLEKVHTKLHEIVNSLVKLCLNNHNEIARQRFSEVEEVSDMLSLILEKLDKRIAGEL